MFPFSLDQWFVAAAALLIPLIVLPFVMRYVVGRIVLFIVRRKHLPAYLKANQEGWEEEKDREVCQAVSSFTLQKLKSLTVMRYRLREDTEQLLLLVQRIYHPNRREETFSYRFSVTKLLECLLLAFGDLYREYASSAWFKVIQNMRVVWLTRMRSLLEFYKRLTGKLPLLQKLLSTRILGKIIRIALIPLLGIPSLLWYTLRSVLVGLFYEGYLRFLYGFLLLKIGYYAPYLYGRKNSLINRRIRQISKERLWIINMRVEERLALSAREERSPHYLKAVEIYLRCLGELGLSEDPEVVRGQETLKKGGRFLERMWETSKRAYLNQNPITAQDPSHLKQVYRLYEVIARVYYPKADQPLLQLRIHEALEMGYMGSILILHKIFSTPGVRALLDHVSVEFVLQAKRFTEDDFLKYGSKYLSMSYRSLRLLRKVQRIFRVFGGGLLPTSLIVTLGSPILVQQLKTTLQEFVYHRAGRLFLYTWETNTLRTQSPLGLLLL
jgi:hypothetical protein